MASGSHKSSSQIKRESDEIWAFCNYEGTPQGDGRSLIILFADFYETQCAIYPWSIFGSNWSLGGFNRRVPCDSELPVQMIFADRCHSMIQMSLVNQKMIPVVLILEKSKNNLTANGDKWNHQCHTHMRPMMRGIIWKRQKFRVFDNNWIHILGDEEDVKKQRALAT
jgi:hypothetical protein